MSRSCEDLKQKLSAQTSSNGSLRMLVVFGSSPVKPQAIYDINLQTAGLETTETGLSLQQHIVPSAELSFSSKAAQCCCCPVADTEIWTRR